MKTTTRDATVEDAPAISELVQASFLVHIAPDWEPVAQESFLAETSVEKLAARIAESSIVLVHEEAERIVGVILLPHPALVQLCFVAPTHIRKGIGRILWEAARSRVEERFQEVKTVELNSSPHAVAAYRAFGFYPISKQFRRRGSVATRMACWLPGRALASVQNAP